MGWDGYDDMPVAALPVEFRMPDIERYTGIGLDEAQMIMLFPLSLSGAAQRWFASLDPSRRRTWADLGQEFIRQYSFNTIVDGISRGLWADSSLSDSKGKKSGSGPRPSDVGTIGMTGHRPAGPTYLHPAPQPVYATQAPQRPLVQFHQQYRAPPPPRPPPHPTPPRFRTDLHCAYHQRVGHDIDNCGLVDLGCPAVTTDPLPTHDTRVVPPPPRDDDLPSEGSNHVRPLFIDVACSGRRVSSILLDNSSVLNVCPLATAIALRFSPSDFGSSTQSVKAYDGTQRTVMGTLTTHVMIGPTSFNLLLRRPWIHEVGVIPSSLHQKVKFIHEGHIIMIQSDRGINDLHLTGFTFDEVQVVGLEDDSETWYLFDHDIPYGLGYTPSEEDARHMARLRRDRGVDRVPEAVEIQGIQQALGQMCLSFETTEPPEAMIVASPSPDRASVFSMCFLEEIPDYDLPMDLGDGSMGASDSMDPPLSFDTMSGFVTRFDDISDGNNDMIIFEYLPVSQHFPLIAPPAPTTHVCDVDDVGDTDDPLSGQSECDSDSDTEDRKVTPISAGELGIGSSLSPDERSRLIDLLRSYLDVFAWSYEDMSGLDPTIVKKEIQKQLSVGFLSVVEYYEWWLMSSKTSFITKWGTYCYRVMPFGLKNAGATYQRVATTLFHDMMHRDVEAKIESQEVYLWAILDMPAPRTEREIRGFLGRLQYISRFIARLTDICEPIFRLLRKNQPTKIKECLLSPPILVPPTPGWPLLLYLFVSDMALGCMLAQLDDSGKERAIYYLSKRMLEYECRYIMIECLCLALVWATRRLRHYMTELMRWLVLLIEFDIQPINDDFHDERFHFFYHHRLTNNIVEYEACIIGLETVLDLGVRQLEIHGDSNLKLKHYHPYLDLLVDRFEELGYIHPPGRKISFLIVHTTSCCLIGDIED
ncbi:hypothetical protein AAG906_032468 [Vitis piasezkii]